MIDYQSSTYTESQESARQFELKAERDVLRHGIITIKINTPALDKATKWAREQEKSQDGR